MTESPEPEGANQTPPWQPFPTPGQPEGATAPPPWTTPDAGPAQAAPLPQSGQPGQPHFGQQPGARYGAPPTPPGYNPAFGGYQPYPPTVITGPGKDPALAEWWRRLLARLIDGTVIVLLTSPLWVWFMAGMYHRILAIANQYPDPTTPAAQAAFNQMSGSLLGQAFLVGAATALLIFCYDWLQHGLWGQTLGKRALGTKVVRADNRGAISGGAAAARAAVYGLVPAVPSVGGLFALLNELWLLWDPQRQCLHDKAARTVVVKVSSLPPAS